MLKREQNELLTQTGPGTSMGELFRRYWIPALLAAELPEKDCPPENPRCPEKPCPPVPREPENDCPPPRCPENPPPEPRLPPE